MGVSGAAEKVEKVRDGERLGLRWVAVKLVLRKSAELDRIPCWRRRCCLNKIETKANAGRAIKSA